MGINEQALSVTQLNEYVKMLIDSDEILQTAAVCGEISNFKHHYATGHLYFTLKDEKSAVKCVMFARDASRLKFEPENGVTVTVWGRVSVFPRDGAYQLYAGFMSPLGLGEQFTAFEQLKKKLLAEGLFDAERKKPIPEYPDRIGIVTSSTGAAVRDLLNILARRWPVAEVELYPALVQGVGAVRSLCAGVKYFNVNRSVDVIIIGRGGGSGEDLNAFNDETLARVIAASEIPVISAVGHETDVSISDFVADLRAPTPSAAAELAVPDMSNYTACLSALLERIKGIVAKNVEHSQNALDLLAKNAVLANPIRHIEIRENEVLYLAHRLDSRYSDIVSTDEAHFRACVAKLNVLSPLSVLERGYTTVEKNNATVTTAKALAHGDRISVRFFDGKVDATVE
ncbi:MAG: exodeoxyribonuclease VII large subunit [Eubacteriales bacterium]